MQEQQPTQRVRLEGYQVFWQTLSAIIVAGLLYLVAAFLFLGVWSVETTTDDPLTDIESLSGYCEANPESVACEPGGIFYEP